MDKNRIPVGPFVEHALKRMGLGAKPKEGDHVIETDSRARKKLRKHLKWLAKRQHDKEDRARALRGQKAPGFRD